MQAEAGVPLVLPRWSLPHVVAHSLESLRERIVRLCAEGVFPALRSDAVFMDSLARSVEENTQALRDVLIGAISLDDVPLDNRLHFTTVEAQMRITQVEMQRSYRLSFFLQWQEWSQLMSTTAERLKVGADEKERAQQSLAATVMVYHDSVVSRLSSNLAESERALSSSRHHVRQRLIEAVLEDGDYDLDPADLITLDYVLDNHHVAILLPNVSASESGRVQEVLRRVAVFERLLVYGHRVGSCVIWLGSSTAWTSAQLEEIRLRLEAEGYAAAMSEPASGRRGLRETLTQAEQVEHIRSTLSDADLAATGGVVRFPDVRLEILLTQDPALAKSFVRQELGPLAEKSREAARLRETIIASFRHGSHVAAAEELGIHEQTVRNRLQRAQELLHPLAERHTELQVALRLWRVFEND